MNTYDSTFERAHSHEFRMVFGYFHFHVFRRLWWSFWSKSVQKDHHKPKTRLSRTISFWNTYPINLLRGSVVEMLGLGVPAKYHNTRRWIRTLRTTSQIDPNWSNLVEISTNCSKTTRLGVVLISRACRLAERSTAGQTTSVPILKTGNEYWNV